MNVTSSSRSSGKRGPRLARRAPTPPSGSGSGFFGWLRALALRGLATGPETNSAFITSCFSLPRNRNAGCDTTSDQDPPVPQRQRRHRRARRSRQAHGGARRDAVAAAAASATALRVLCSTVSPSRITLCCAISNQGTPARLSAPTISSADRAGLAFRAASAARSSSQMCRRRTSPSACMLRRRWSRVPVFAFEVAMRRSTHRSCIGRSWRVDASWRPRDDGFGFEATGADSRDPRVVAFLPEPLAPSRATRAIADARASGALARGELAADPRLARAAASAARFTERHIPPVAPRAQPHASRDRETLARADCGRPRTGARHPQPRGRTRPPAYLSDAPPTPIEDTPARSRSPDSRATQYAARGWRRPLQPPARCRHQTGGNHAHRADIIFLVSAWRAKNESRSPSLVLESFSESCD